MDAAARDESPPLDYRMVKDSGVAITKCKWCNDNTLNVLSNECSSCWSLRRSVEADRSIVLRMLRYYPEVAA